NDDTRFLSSPSTFSANLAALLSYPQEVQYSRRILRPFDMVRVPPSRGTPGRGAEGVQPAAVGGLPRIILSHLPPFLPRLVRFIRAGRGERRGAAGMGGIVQEGGAASRAKGGLLLS